jgi:prepilin-type N-terminal cleavage/methylation domain-containing protein
MKTTIRKSGFTLIELLIVIGLLAALAAVLLPTLMGTREDALAGIDKYNAAGTLRTLRQYEAMTGDLPNGMHTGLATSTGTDLMDVTTAFEKNAKQSGSITTLTPSEITALSNVGITKLAYGAGVKDNPTASLDAVLGYVNISSTTNVISVTPDWVGEDDAPITFNGKTIAALEEEGYSKIINLFITPTANWNSESTGWVKGFGVKLDVPGTCPIVDEDFSYYTVFIGIMSEGAKYSTTSTGSTPTAPAPSSQTGASVSDLQTAINTAVTNNNSDSYWEWEDAWDDGVRVLNYDNTSGTTGSVTYTVEALSADDVKAVLLGTSCPEHGVTNP